MRIQKALAELSGVKRLLDIGTHDGTLFRETGATGVGIDPELIDGPAPDGVTMVRGFFPSDLPAPPDQPFDAATALAVVEHIPEEELATWAKSLAGMIAPGGAVVITVPAPAVDKILHVLIALRLIAGIEAHQHHGFKPSDLETIFAAPHWRLSKHQRFQLGLNHLYVFERTND
ncbi:MAG TPA: class I SAM-dependent methyltransferase [Streptosporangiaceae bacterium]|nr:class I SAM-dependent methyltransferase [Streptosporangiaceae bacterium]